MGQRKPNTPLSRERLINLLGEALSLLEEDDDDDVPSDCSSRNCGDRHP